MSQHDVYTSCCDVTQAPFSFGIEGLVDVLLPRKSHESMGLGGAGHMQGIKESAL